MAEKLQLIFEIVTQDNKATATLKSVEDQAKKTDKAVDGIGTSLVTVNSISKTVGTTFSSLSRSMLSLGATFAGLLGGFTLFRAIKESTELENSLIGLRTVANRFGVDQDYITKKAKQFASDGLIPLTDVAASLKNLLSTGVGADKAIAAFEALRDSASFNRQAQFDLGGAIRSTTEGIKSQLSQATDNAGITTNLSILQKRYADSLGISAAKLTEFQKALANVTGITKEASIFQGDYNKLLLTFSGATAGVFGSLKILLASLGDLITKNPLVIVGLLKIKELFLDLTIAMDKNAETIRSKTADAFKTVITVINNLDTIIPKVITSVTLLGTALLIFNGPAIIGGISAITNELKILLGTLNLLSGGLAILAGVSINLFINNLIDLRKEFGTFSGVFEAFKIQGQIAAAQLEIAFASLSIKLDKIGQSFEDSIGAGLAKLGIGFTKSDFNKTIVKSTQNIEDLDKKIKDLQLSLVDLSKKNKVVVAPTIDPKAVNKLFSDMENVAKTTGKVIDRASEDAKAANSAQFNDLINKLKNVGKTATQILDSELKERLSVVQTELKNEVINEATAREARLKIYQDYNKRLKAAQDKEDKEEKESLAKKIKEFNDIISTNLKSPFNNLFKDIAINSDFTKHLFKNGEIKESVEAQLKKVATPLSLIAGIGSQITKGADNLLKAISTGIGEAFGPAGKALASIANEFIDLFGQAPAEFTKKLSATLTNIPTLLANIITNVAALASSKIMKQIVTDFVGQLPFLIESLTTAIVEVMASPAFWVDIAFAFVSALVQAIVAVPQAIINGFKAGFRSIADIFKGDLITKGGEFLEDFGKKFLEIPKKFFETLKDLFEKYNPISLLSKLFRFDGGGKGVVESFIGLDFPFVKFATGGRVPGVSKVGGDSLKNDTVPALLSPGEVVLPRSVVKGGTGKVFEFLKDIGLPIGQFGFGKLIGSVGKVFSSVASSAGAFATNAVEGIGDLGSALARGDINGVLDSIKQSFLNIGQITLPKEIRDVIETLIRLGAKVNVVDFIKNPVNAAKNSVLTIRDSFLQPGFKKMVHLQSGGEGKVLGVPQGFPADSFRANLTSGELVVDRSTANQLKQFLNSPNQQNESLLTQIHQLLSRPMQVQTTVELDNRAFANILLDLSRTNARVTI